MEKRKSDFVNTEKENKDSYDENKTVKRTTLIPLGIFAFIVAIWAIIRICQIYIPAPDDTKVAIDALLGLLTLAVIAAQSAIIRMQWRAMQDAVGRTDKIIEQGERSMMYSQSAYVIVDGISLTRYTKGDTNLFNLGSANNQGN